ncbi:MAG TPA: CocE/NonD family hydrolase, partial [Bacteroidota bacterium]|nr:CocE/NonD family hydrolase [Bacteroidota bacterium]
MKQLITTCVMTLSLCCTAFTACAQERFDVAEQFTKREYQIPMRDGVKLFTCVYTPIDTLKDYPILLNRTPYSVAPYGVKEYKRVLGPSDISMKQGYIFVYQDVRGKMMSEGQYENIRPVGEHTGSGAVTDECTDTYDTIEWLVKHLAHTNGRVGLYGISYPGFYAALGLVDAHPALKAVSPQAPIADWFIGDDFHHNGALFLLDAFNFMSGFGKQRPAPTTNFPSGYHYRTTDPYRFFLDVGAISNINKSIFKNEIAFWNDMSAHGTYDAFWKSRNLPSHLGASAVKPAVLTVGGLFDAEDFYGTLRIYQALEQHAPAGMFNALVLGPWFHGGWSRSPGEELGNITFGSRTSDFYRDSIESVFFRYYLKDEGSIDRLAEASVFQTGSNRWKRYSAWPPPRLEKKKLYFNRRGRLSFLPPEANDGFDEYVSDPAHPVPYTQEIHTNRNREYMTEDQRFAYYRPDVVSYETTALDEDLTIAGPITVELYVSTTGTDADFIVKVIDVLPDDTQPASTKGSTVPMGGYQYPVRMDVMRGKFRNSYEKPEAFIPNEVTRVRFTLNDINHQFRAGH